jgi:hypothetical protein
MHLATTFNWTYEEEDGAGMVVPKNRGPAATEGGAKRSFSELFGACFQASSVAAARRHAGHPCNYCVREAVVRNR